MSTQRFSPEFKKEAVRQVLERGYSVAGLWAQIRLEEERDLLIKPRGTMPASPSEVPLHE